jgi:hypothetical protein
VGIEHKVPGLAAESFAPLRRHHDEVRLALLVGFPYEPEKVFGVGLELG